MLLNSEVFALIVFTLFIGETNALLITVFIFFCDDPAIMTLVVTDGGIIYVPKQPTAIFKSVVVSLKLFEKGF